MNMPAIAAMTVKPEMSTARPEVAAAISSAASGDVALVALLHLAAEVEHRVVDADGEADERSRPGSTLVGQRLQLAERPEEPDACPRRR